MKAHYVLTTFSPAMFGSRAVFSQRVVSQREADQLVDDRTEIVARAAWHERLARDLFPQADPRIARFANMKPGMVGVLIHYRGSPIGPDGKMPHDAQVTYYLIEVKEYES